MTTESVHESDRRASADGRSFKGKRGLRRLPGALRYSLDGLATAWEHEDAFRMEVIVALLAIPAAILLPVSLVERLMMIATVALILIVEVLNTGIEAAVDRDSYEINPLGKRAKDLGSAAVLLAIALALVVWISILVSRFA